MTLPLPVRDLAGYALMGGGAGLLITAPLTPWVAPLALALIATGTFMAFIARRRAVHRDAHAWRIRTGHTTHTGTHLDPDERAGLLGLDRAQHDALTACGILPGSLAIDAWERTGPALERWFAQCVIEGDCVPDAILSASGPAADGARRIIWETSLGPGDTWLHAGSGPRHRVSPRIGAHLIRAVLIGPDVRAGDAEVTVSAPRAIGAPRVGNARRAHDARHPAPFATPVLYGTPEPGEALMCDPQIQVDVHPTTVAIIWERSDDGVRWEESRASTEAGLYVLSADDVGCLVRARLAHYRGGSASTLATSTPAGPIGSAEATATAAPGRARPGGTVSLRDRLAGR